MLCYVMCCCFCFLYFVVFCCVVLFFGCFLLLFVVVCCFVLFFVVFCCFFVLFVLFCFLLFFVLFVLFCFVLFFVLFFVCSSVRPSVRAFVRLFDCLPLVILTKQMRDFLVFLLGESTNQHRNYTDELLPFCLDD